MFVWFKKKPKYVPIPGEPEVIVFVTPLIMLLSGREKQKGSPLTEDEVYQVRDEARCLTMPRSQAEIFYSSLDSQVPVMRLDPDRIWEQWQEVRLQIENEET